jgi:hypothetical protein
MTGHVPIQFTAAMSGPTGPLVSSAVLGGFAGAFAVVPSGPFQKVQSEDSRRDPGTYQDPDQSRARSRWFRAGLDVQA